ncbi:MAG TPA: DHH family phosphoesterase [Acidobacteriota bacterium]|nr:DHH family phosphoesterase [Acidobacteriota bacterium]
MIRKRRSLLILTHNNPDPDSVASGWALRQAVLQKLGIDGILAYGGVLGRAENQTMVRKLQINMTHVREVDFKKDQAIAIVDTQPRTGNNPLPSGVAPDVVIDHHPLRQETIGVPYYDVREDYGATSTMLLEYLSTAGVKLTRELATALFYAIKSETVNLVREVHQADVQAYLKLYPLVDQSILTRIEQAPVSREYYHAFHIALENSYICKQVVISRLHSVRNPDIVSEIAEFLLRLRGIEWTLAMAMHSSDLILSTRTIGLDHDAGAVMRQVVGDYGTAGGHGMMAGGQIHISNLNQHAVEQLEEELTDRFLQIILGDGASKVVREPLIQANGKGID